ncbi:MAG: hypothetical protein ACUVRC_04200 [Desulfotomaculales bacterium]
MATTVLLAAIRCADLQAAYAAVRAHGLAVFGTMDGAKLEQLKAAPAGQPVTVYLYAPT